SIVECLAGQPIRTAVYGPVRTVVWEGSGREACPYPDPCVSWVAQGKPAAPHLSRFPISR
ncbi:hypothetical protein, partial [Paraburkholderia domus]|uniref:hypothetical protein n=1 Tax=Paraburkholderia domus TaxID=2793075 RepID=UPI001B8B6814